jgi:hypothetical protein
MTCISSYYQCLNLAKTEIIRVSAAEFNLCSLDPILLTPHEWTCDVLPATASATTNNTQMVDIASTSALAQASGDMSRFVFTFDICVLLILGFFVGTYIYKNR